MPAEDPKAADAILNLGYDYADKAFPFFSEKYSDKPTLGQLSSFSGTAGATMLGTMYAVIVQNAGLPEAEVWLSRMFSLLAAVVRQKGVPVSLTFRATATPVPLVEEAPGKPAAAPKAETPVPPCACAIDADGICPTCPASLKEHFTKAISVLTGFARSISDLKTSVKPACRACDAAYLDAAFASAIFRGAMAETRKADAAYLDQIFFMIIQLGAQRGVKEMPLSEQAWAGFMEKMSAPEDKTP